MCDRRAPMGTDRRIGVVGLGYVGLPIAVHFGRKGKVIGFDVNARRADELCKGLDRNGDVHADDLAKADVDYTTDAAKLKAADFVIVTVPTPVDDANRPDLSPLAAASET